MQGCWHCWAFHHLREFNLRYGGDGNVLGYGTPRRNYDIWWVDPSKPATHLEWIDLEQLARDSASLASKLPHLSGVAGIPRSGMIPASIISTLLHVPLYEVTTSGLRRLAHGMRGDAMPFTEDGPIAVIDDTVHHGAAMRKARQNTRAIDCIYCAVYIAPGPSVVDYYVRELAVPHVLSWNLANNWMKIGMDLDGVIVHDSFSGSAPGLPHLVPRAKPVEAIITGRQEATRGETERLLADIGARYKRLVMWDGEKSIAEFKARALVESSADIYIESCPKQARQIWAMAGKPVVCPRARTVWR